MDELGHVRFVCPGTPQAEHFRLDAVPVSGTVKLEGVAATECPGFRTVGSGQVKSAERVLLQNGRICSYKYHCR